MQPALAGRLAGREILDVAQDQWHAGVHAEREDRREHRALEVERLRGRALRRWRQGRASLIPMRSSTVKKADRASESATDGVAIAVPHPLTSMVSGSSVASHVVACITQPWTHRGARGFRLRTVPAGGRAMRSRPA